MERKDIKDIINTNTNIKIKRPILEYKFIKRESGYTLYIRKEFGAYYHPISNDTYNILVKEGM